ncbi:hypothetical protein [Pedobacter aquatilis]|uniref:hypothetical protein n=1 Tax=Pedobacter aquatilis TaxID=351343 RepID=UPI00292D16C8|nr:hypothetical protein [Pedobacter aquatilis]
MNDETTSHFNTLESIRKALTRYNLSATSDVDLFVPKQWELKIISDFVSRMKSTDAYVVKNNKRVYLTSDCGLQSATPHGIKCNKRRFTTLLRLKRLYTYAICAKFAVAEEAVIYLDKRDIIRLQLYNACNTAKIYLFQQDIFSSFSEAYQKKNIATAGSGYFVSGSKFNSGNESNFVRRISKLKVILI